MERSQLLKEAAQKLLSHHHQIIQSNSLQDTDVRSSLIEETTVKSNDKSSRLKSYQQMHSVIYINPSVIGSSSKPTSNSASLKEQSGLPNIGSLDRKQVKRHTVFINPNFNKSASVHHNITHKTESKSELPVINQPKVSSLPEFKINKLIEGTPESSQKPNSFSSTLNTKIFINPKFNRPKHSLKCCTKNADTHSCLDGQMTSVTTTEIVLNSSENTSYNVEVNQNVPQPPKIVKTTLNKINSVSLKRKNDERESSDERLQTTHQKKSAKKIFVNPSYKKVVMKPKVLSDQKNINDLKKIANDLQLSTSTSTSQCSNADSCTQHKPHCQIDMDNQMKRSNNNLESVSPTKMIRKRKLSQGSSKKKCSKRIPLIFLSNTKLVRKNSISYDKDIVGLNKNVIKRAVPRTQLNLLNAEQVKRIRKQNFVASIKNLKDMHSSNVVTKVKSKNGKSLKLIRKSLDSSAGNEKSLKLIRNAEDLPTVANTLSSNVVTSVKSKNGKSLKLIRKSLDSSVILRVRSGNGKSLKLIRNTEDLPTVTNTPSSNVVTKVKSKNGKSLKLIRKSLDSSVILRVRSGNGKSLKLIRNTEDLSTAANIKSRNSISPILIRKIIESKEPWNENRHDKYTVPKQTHFHIQQASKRAQQFLLSKWRQNQFSKINVPLNRKPTANRSKYVYERNRNLIANTSPRAKVEGKQPLHNNFTCKFAIKNAKSNISKYKLVRKADIKSTSQELKNFGAKTSPSTSSKKWKKSKLVIGNLQRKQLSIVNIGGVFYRCTRTSLCKNKSLPGKDQQAKGPLLKIRGQKFQFDDNGRTLKCLDNKPVRNRIDIGGVTFVRSSSGNSLTRTNYHTTRSILTQAKQKSLTTLINKRRKNNEPCPFYHRFGRCSGKERGTCIRQHDKKYVAVCKKFVAGTCKDSKCLLSHITSAHNMPTCQHYLAGQCGRDNCPYPHIKLSDSAPLCIDFLKGFCIRGEQCTKRHLELCPSFERGACPRGKFCPYPHPKSNDKHKRVVKAGRKKPYPPVLEQKSVSINKRYFEDTQLQEENKIQLEESEDRSSADQNAEGEDVVHRLKNRPKLGRLPSYIPLNQESSCSESARD